VKNIYKILCINNKPFTDEQNIQNITIGKIYHTYDKPVDIDISGNYVVINDLGNEVLYSSNRFEPVTEQEWRDRQLNKIL